MVLDGKSSKEYPVNAGVPQGSILASTLFLLYINDLPDDVICKIAINADDTTLYSTYEVRSGLLISMLGKLSWFRLAGLITVVLLMWKWMGLFSKKNQHLRCWVWPSLLNWIGVLTFSLLLKLHPRKLEL